MRAYRAVKYRAESYFYQFDVKTRWFALAAALLLPLMVAWLLITMLSIEPQRATQQLRAVQNELISAEQTLASIEAEINSGEYQQLQQRIEQLTQLVDRSNEAVVALSDSVIRQSDVQPLMTQLLANYPGITMRSISKAPAQPLLISENEAQLYKHSLAIEVSGDYLSVLAWLQQVEAFGAKIFWQTLTIEQQGATSVVAVTLHTISRNEEWIDV